MKLKDIKKTIEQIALSLPNVNTFIFGDVYQLNTMKDAKYSAIAVTQNSHREDDEYRYYGLNLFYIDRNTNDNGNVLDNQSVGIEILDTLISDLEAAGVLIESDRTYQPFTENFNQLCSGVYVTLNLQVEKDECGEDNINIVTSVNGRTGDVWVSEGGGTTYTSITEDAKTTNIENETINLNGDVRIRGANAVNSYYLKSEGYLTEYEMANKGYVTDNDLVDYARKDELMAKADRSELNEYARREDLMAKADKTELSKYLKTTDADNTFVKSETVRRISVMSQADYDELTYKFDDVLFIIID